MKTKWQVVLWVDGVEKEVHNFELDYDKKGWYISTTSISAFSTREKNRLNDYVQKQHSYNMPGKRCQVSFGKDIDFAEETRKLFKEALGIKFHPHDDLPQFHHESVWDFYKAIGYDYKKKRYVK